MPAIVVVPSESESSSIPPPGFFLFPLFRITSWINSSRIIASRRFTCWNPSRTIRFTFLKRALTWSVNWKLDAAFGRVFQPVVINVPIISKVQAVPPGCSKYGIRWTWLDEQRLLDLTFSAIKNCLGYTAKRFIAAFRGYRLPYKYMLPVVMRHAVFQSNLILLYV